MKTGINLKLPKKKPSQAGKKVFYYSIIILVVAFTIGVSTVTYSLFLETSLKTLSEQRESLKSQILSQKTKYYKLQDVHERLKNIQAIIKGRLKAIDKVDNIANTLPDDSKIVSVLTKDLDITYTITNTDLSKINSLLEQKLLDLAAQKEKSVKTVELISLEYVTEDRLYKLKFKVKF